VLLVRGAPELETAKREERRDDVEIDTRDFDRTPKVVAKGETGLLRLEGARARLYGDEAGTAGWTVDNVLLLEVLDRSDKVIARRVVGFSDPVIVAREQVDNVGRMSFTFGPGEVDLTSSLPESEPFRLRATVLDYNAVGKASDVFLVFEPRPAARDDDLHD